MVTELERNTAQVAAAHTKYVDNPLLDNTDVQDDLDDRVTMANATHTAVDNDELGTDLNTDDATVAGGVHPVYTGGNVVNNDDPLVMDTLVRDSLDADTLFTKGGQIPPTDFETVSNTSPYVDPTWLVEASKQTGEKFF